LIVNQNRDCIVATDEGAVRIKDIKYIDYSMFSDLQTIRLRIDGKDGWEIASDFNALMLVYAVTPTWLEGKPFIKWKKNSWAVHNLFAHPLMQILAFFKLYKLAMKVHHSTVPRPIGFK